MEPRKQLVGCLVWSACCLLLSDCGTGNPETGKVTGKVTVEGKPVTEGTVMFYPEEGKASVGAIGSDGTYSLTTFDLGDGALVGSHQVTITAYRMIGGTEQPKTFKEELALAKEGTLRRASAPKTEWLVPEKYSDRGSSPLQKKVASGAITINFQLP